MRGGEFIDRIKKLGRERGLKVVFEKSHGKGSHGTLWLGDRKTTVKDRKKEIGAGLLAAMLDQLGVSKKEFR
jgi:mRNA interferase HicA